jgi:hypothetical protein
MGNTCSLCQESHSIKNDGPRKPIDHNTKEDHFSAIVVQTQNCPQNSASILAKRSHSKNSSQHYTFSPTLPPEHLNPRSSLTLTQRSRMDLKSGSIYDNIQGEPQSEEFLNFIDNKSPQHSDSLSPSQIKNFFKKNFFLDSKNPSKIIPPKTIKFELARL